MTPAEMLAHIGYREGQDFKVAVDSNAEFIARWWSEQGDDYDRSDVLRSTFDAKEEAVAFSLLPILVRLELVDLSARDDTERDPFFRCAGCGHRVPVGACVMPGQLCSRCRDAAIPKEG